MVWSTAPYANEATAACSDAACGDNIAAKTTIIASISRFLRPVHARFAALRPERKALRQALKKIWWGFWADGHGDAKAHLTGKKIAFEAE